LWRVSDCSARCYRAGLTRDREFKRPVSQRGRCAVAWTERTATQPVSKVVALASAASERVSRSMSLPRPSGRASVSSRRGGQRIRRASGCRAPAIQRIGSGADGAAASASRSGASLAWGCATHIAMRSARLSGLNRLRVFQARGGADGAELGFGYSLRFAVGFLGPEGVTGPEGLCAGVLGMYLDGAQEDEAPYPASAASRGRRAARSMRVSGQVHDDV
jgi:hypothetical protein